MGLITRAETLPAPGETLRGERFYSSPGGKGATQAVAASRQGARVRMVGRVGDDLFGPALLESLRSHGGRHCRRRRRSAGRVRGGRHPRRRQRPEPGPGDLRRQPALRGGAVAGGRGRPAGDRRPAVADGDPTRGIPAGRRSRQGPERPRHPRPGPGCRHSGGRLGGVRYHRAEPDGS